ncbi:DNA-directed RNA polymerase subunit omega [Campylobacter fetus subsp. testudinum]|uniref:DNA-directed RNA polymerase subunit omega n=2 Tax=Campylobacter fetus TaxID=196 RepID=A0AAX0HDK4_CAMFE|nr:DNA-directed RNA polymerase, omega subunit [Campylobacter fetus subsp. testudinum 03-427]AJB45777.1 DNA-directed RNA polymerase subunit omega [Campylobacter fetus subsp. testudinum]ALV65209.1 DNA-directed RNA polymerase, omega subunit [Campylobacter fetus subsp. testudinum Sp3]EAI4321912.1 DNA-directed RNA polymerase subunit omega [Campylobacter fetus]AVK81475.1 DNA-directed RNA polymerase subunit omega [Campylobacter fetus subsp. testudinum]
MQRTEEIAAKALQVVGDDRYKLALLVAKRAEMLAEGAAPLVKINVAKMKFTDIALLEISEGKVLLEALVESSR